jgi:hypothetical protein
MIDETLDALLHRRSYLKLFLEDPNQLGLPPDVLDALATTDRDELVATAKAVRRELMNRHHRGSGSLIDLYPSTIGERDAEELVADFMESTEYGAYREIPFSGVGFSLEEAFYRYCEAREIGERETRRREFSAAIVKALLFSPRADFLVPPEVHRCPGGVFVLAGTTLYAALGPRFVTGPITPFLVDLLASAEAGEAIAERHGVSREGLDAAVGELRALGLRT